MGGSQKQRPTPLLTGAWSKGCRIDDLHRPINSFVRILFSARGWKTETIRNSWGGSCWVDLCCLSCWRESEVCITEAYLACTIRILIMHISHISMYLANVYLMINYICCCLRRYFGYGKIIKHLILERVISNHLVSWVHIKENHPV